MEVEGFHFSPYFLPIFTPNKHTLKGSIDLENDINSNTMAGLFIFDSFLVEAADLDPI
jgi:hypothetical protein